MRNYRVPPHPMRTKKQIHGQARSDHTHADGWINAVTGLGVVGRDPRRHIQIETAREISRSEIDALYRTDAVFARIVDVPAQDMIRAWFQIDMSMDAEDEDADVIASVDLARWISGIQDKLDELHARRELGRALRWARLYGGAIVLIGAQGAGNLDRPLDLASLEDIRWLRALHRYQATPEGTIADHDSPLFGEPEYYRLTALGADVDAPIAHASRVLRFDGVDMPPGAAHGTYSSGLWGDPIALRVIEPLRDFQSSYEATAAMIGNFAQTVWGLPGVGRMIAEGKEDLLHKRAAVVDFVRSVVNAVIVDSEIGETFERKSTPVDGLPDLLDRNGIRLAASAGMPLTLMLGLAPKGFATEDKSGQENWDDVIRAKQEESLRSPLDRLIELILSSSRGPSGGRLPSTWAIGFNPLVQPTEEQRASVRKTMAEADQIYLANEVLSADEVAASRFGSDGYSIDTTIDMAARQEFADAERAEERARLAEAEAELERMRAEVPAEAVPTAEDA